MPRAQPRICSAQPTLSLVMCAVGDGSVAGIIGLGATAVLLLSGVYVAATPKTLCGGLSLCVHFYRLGLLPAHF